MRVSLNGKEFHVKWNHYLPFNTIEGKVLPEEQRFWGCTTCWIEDVNSKEVLNEGIAICAKGDVFCKNSGRIISLKKALTNFPKEDREVFWDEYSEQIVNGRFVQWVYVWIHNGTPFVYKLVSSKEIDEDMIFAWFEKTFERKFDDEKDEITFVDEPTQEGI